MLSESERAGWWSELPELPEPEWPECTECPECWLPTTVIDDADAEGELRKGGYECSRWLRMSIARVLPLSFGPPAHSVVADVGSDVAGLTSPHVEQTYLMMSRRTPQLEQFVGSEGGARGCAGRIKDKTSGGMSGWM